MRRSAGLTVCGAAAMAGLCLSAGVRQGAGQATSPASLPSAVRATAPATTSAPASDPTAAFGLDWVDEPLAAADQCVGELERLRPVAGAKGDLVSAALNKGLAALDAAEKRLAGQADKPPGLPLNHPILRSTEAMARYHRQVAVRKCQAALARGQLCLAAAAALPPDHADRRQHIQRAVDIAGALRIDYRDLPLALMGYIWEARAQRLADRPDSALAVLEAVLKMPVAANAPAAAELRRAAMLERLQTLLMVDPSAALKEAAQWRSSAELRGNAAWQQRLDWLAAQGQLLEIEGLRRRNAAPNQQQVRTCAESLRSEGVVKTAPPYDRLAAVMKLDALAGGRIAARNELLEWAMMQASAGDTAATTMFNRVLAMPGEPLSLDQMHLFATLLWTQGAFAQAAGQCDAMLRRMTPADDRYGGILQLRASCLLKLYQQEKDKLPDAQREALLAALRAVYESDLPAPARRDALVQWVGAAGTRLLPGELLAALDAQAGLLKGDGYLLYSQAMCRWSLIAHPPAVATQPSAESARDILQTLKAAQAAVPAENQPLLARILLLHAQVLAGPPLRDARAALQALNDGREAISADKTLAGQAAWLRVQLMMDLNLVDAAVKELADLPEDAGIGQAAVPLRLAEVLAERYATAEATGRDRLQQQVIAFCNRAVSQSLTGKDYQSVLMRAASALLKANALADAMRVLDNLLNDKSIPPGGEAFLTCALMRAEALQKSGKPAEALAALEELTRKYPKSGAVQLSYGRCQMALRQEEKAAESFRLARRISRPGGAEWCQATLELAGALKAQGLTAAAADILRVSGALYPDFGNPELRAGLIRMRESLSAQATQRGGPS